MLSQAFQQYQNPDTVVSVADQILCAATQAAKLNFIPTAAGRLAIAIDGDEPFEVELPYHRVSTFRTLLARVGVICGAAAEKRSLMGKSEALLKRAGLVRDRFITEQSDVQYQAVVRDYPGSPLYNVDADLNVRQPNGVETKLHVVMQNSGHDLFLRIENRSNCEP